MDECFLPCHFRDRRLQKYQTSWLAKSVYDATNAANATNDATNSFYHAAILVSINAV